MKADCVDILEFAVALQCIFNPFADNFIRTHPKEENHKGETESKTNYQNPTHSYTVQFL